MDLSHALFIHGWVLAYKPRRILELGYGTGLTTEALVSAVKYNGVGEITCVDNWQDFGGDPPVIPVLDDACLRFTASEEKAFCESCPDDKYDFLVSDADHHGDRFDQHLRIVRDGGICVFHDTNNPGWRGLFKIESIAHSRGVPCVHFRESTRRDERCERGLLLVINRK